MRTSVSNIRILRSGPIGSISAWLPSRKSTLHQIGALVMVRPGHFRSGRLMGWNGRYFKDGSTRMAVILGFRVNRRMAVTEESGRRSSPRPGDRDEVAAPEAKRVLPVDQPVKHPMDTRLAETWVTRFVTEQIRLWSGPKGPSSGAISTPGR